MKEGTRAEGVVRSAAVALLVLSLAGCCFFGGEYALDEPIGRKRVARIVPGRTTVREALTWLGPPAAIARRGGTVIVPAPSLGKTADLELQSDAFFELFEPGRPPREGEAVYYYAASSQSSQGKSLILVVVSVGEQTYEIKTERLWLLVDERTGIVEDHVYRVGGRNIVGRASSRSVEGGQGGERRE